MLKQPGTYTIEELEYHSNMSLKTFERKFMQQVGLSPKLFERLRRFNQALDLKTYQPRLSWLDISYKSGYYDPMQMVKEVF
ncbi:helix-turn-helix domain-containing protein [Aquiflexum sp.]|uniref:helix-turn-helix domain-containing protein n=1 Tax=Aquiflexum sp. TaxID=1872584 RepID=UPI003593FF5E